MNVSWRFCVYLCLIGISTFIEVFFFLKLGGLSICISPALYFVSEYDPQNKVVLSLLLSL